jgi:putative nucleotidyltransferase with HDIG domain
LNRDEAWKLLCEWTKGDSLRKHMLAVEAAMRAYARKFGGDEERWGITGLLHDMDYETHPTPSEHPMVGVRELEQRGYPEDVIEAIKGHADYLDVPRTTPMAKTLYAVDELSGFVTACALVRPEGLEGLKAKSVRKKMKQKSFAASVSREDITRAGQKGLCWCEALGSCPSRFYNSRLVCSLLPNPTNLLGRAVKEEPKAIPT